jgi:hypothetical protein
MAGPPPCAHHGIGFAGARLASLVVVVVVERISTTLLSCVADVSFDPVVVAVVLPIPSSICHSLPLLFFSVFCFAFSSMLHSPSLISFLAIAVRRSGGVRVENGAFVSAFR